MGTEDERSREKGCKENRARKGGMKRRDKRKRNKEEMKKTRKKSKERRSKPYLMEVGEIEKKEGKGKKTCTKRSWSRKMERTAIERHKDRKEKYKK